MDARSVRAAREQNQRRELFWKRSKSNETFVDLGDIELTMNSKLKNSTSTVDDILAQGAAILSSLRGQGADLHRVKRKALDIGRALNLSTETLRTIEKLVQEDWMILICCCILSLFFMYVFYRFWKG